MLPDHLVKMKEGTTPPKKKKKKKKHPQISGPCKRTEKVGDHEGDSDTNHSGNPWNNLQQTDWRNWRSNDYFYLKIIIICFHAVI